MNVSASCLNIGSIIGGLFGGYLGGRVGPRRTLQLACALGLVSWLLMALAPHLSGKCWLLNCHYTLTALLSLVSPHPRQDPQWYRWYGRLG